MLPIIGCDQLYRSLTSSYLNQVLEQDCGNASLFSVEVCLNYLARTPDLTSQKHLKAGD